MFHVEHFCTIWPVAARSWNAELCFAMNVLPTGRQKTEGTHPKPDHPRVPEIDIDPTVLILYPPDQPIAKPNSTLVNQPK
jgi:hypothetical protein